MQKGIKNLLHPDRFFSANERERSIARLLYQSVVDLPIVSPHGHTDPVWFAENKPFKDPADLFIKPDHYVFRMLYSQGVSLEKLGIPRVDGQASNVDPRDVWRVFAEHFYLFQGTPSRLWFEHALQEVFGIEERLSSSNADDIYDRLDASLQTAEFLPRSLFDRFNIECLATTEAPLDELGHHDTILKSDWNGNVITTYRPDPVLDPEYEGFLDNVQRLGELTSEDVFSFSGYLDAHRKRRAYFQDRGATATDHGHPDAYTANLSSQEKEALYARVMTGKCDSEDARLFRGQMLTEMALMSLDDGMVMQLHPGSYRNHNQQLFKHFGRDKGSDIPMATDYVHGLAPLLNRVGNDASFSLIVFTLDETAYGRELAPLAGHYPALKVGPPWWFFDSPEGMLRFKRAIHETAGFYNTAGFNDDTRAFLSIPARHDMSRRLDCRFLAELVADHRLDEEEAADIARQLAYELAKKAYRLG